MLVQKYSEKEYLKKFEELAIERLHKIFLPNYKKALKGFRNKTILDIGCGDGSLTSAYAKGGAKVIGIDSSKNWETTWNKNFEKSTNLKFQVMDATKIKGFKKNKFDAITMNMVILNISTPKEIRKIFKSAFQLLKKNGVFVFSDLNPVAVMSKNLPDRTFSFSKNFSYWKDGTNFKAHAMISKNNWITFNDKHWTLELYTTLLAKEGFYLEKIIEPKRPTNMQNANKWKVPEFIMFVSRKK